MYEYNYVVYTVQYDVLYTMYGTSVLHLFRLITDCAPVIWRTSFAEIIVRRISKRDDNNATSMTSPFCSVESIKEKSPLFKEVLKLFWSQAVKMAESPILTNKKCDSIKIYLVKTRVCYCTVKYVHMISKYV